MAHPSKFVSVNLNKSYGQPANPSSSSYASSARARPGPHSGGGGGMVVLSRPRSSSSSASAQKSGGPKLSVPPPLNLPSLRKENEKFDLSSASGSSARPGSSGIGSGSGSSSMGWTKPAPVLLQDMEAPPSSVRSGSSSYMPPAARGIGQVVAHSSPAHTVDKAVFLRGEDFPSLKATATLKQKEKSKDDEGEKPEFHSPLRMRPQMRSSRLTNSNVADGDDTGLSRSSELSQKQQQQEKQDKYFAGPLPLVKLTHTSDWADDERDTGLSLPERDRDRGFSRSEYSRDAEVVSFSSRDLYKGDSFGRSDLIGSNKDVWDMASSWRMPTVQPRDDRVGSVKPFGPSREVNRDSSSSNSPYGNNARDGPNNSSPTSRFARRDLGYGSNIQNGMNVAEGFSGRGIEQQNIRAGHYGGLSNNNRYRDNFQQNAASKLPFSHGRQGPPLNDPILNFGREKTLNSSNSGKLYHGDTGFDGSDPFSDDSIADVNMKVFKKKKDIQKHADFYDPARESFEAELERVQRIQEQERQRVMEEQARAMELARREQEERERLAREEEERRRLIEEETREAAWRAEQEKMEAARRAEEQKRVREEEKRRMLMEEERRKEAARRKLMELEARIASRQSESTQEDETVPSSFSDECVPGMAKEKDIPKASSDVGDWEDGERMVEHITSTPSDSSMNKYFDRGSSSFSSARDAGSSFAERGKHGNYWKRDVYDHGTSSVFHPQDQEGDYHSLKRDALGSGRGFPRKDSCGSFGIPPIRPSSKGGSSDHSSGPDDLRYIRGNRWNVGGEGDHFTRDLEVDAADFLDNDRFRDGGWGTGRHRGSPNALYSERSFQNPEIDSGFPSYGRSRHSLRQPRVLPPPSISSIRQSHSSFRDTADHPFSSSFLDNQSRYQQGGRSEEVMQSGYDGDYHQRIQQPTTAEVLESDVTSSEQKEKDSPRCDSQSSLSVSNPPSSPTQLSHDELDETEEARAVQTSLDEQTILSDSELVSAMEGENTIRMTTASSISHGEDDEWVTENNEEMQEQEEYDEEDSGYQEEEEATHDDGGNLDSSQEFNDPASSDMPNTAEDVGQLVLGFDEGVEVSIPLDDGLENITKNLEKLVPEDSVSDHRLQVDAFTEDSISESSKMVSETEKALQQFVLDPVTSSASSPSDSEHPTSVQGLPDQQPVTSTLSLPTPPSTVRPISSMVSTAESQAEAPIRLQFGLFSGPSLLPSPVPAIQIGSIQMPLHLHQQTGSSIAQMHPSQPPFFQFGQLRYPSPIAQGILPIAPQPSSFVHPSTSAQYSSTQNIGGSRNKQSSQDSSSQDDPAGKVTSGPVKEQGVVTKMTEETVNFEQPKGRSNAQNSVVASRGQADDASGDRNRQVSGYRNIHHVLRDVAPRKNYRTVINNRESPVYQAASQLSLEERAQTGTRASGITSSRGRRFTYTVRNAGTRLPFSMPENSRTDSSLFQRRPRRTVRRTEFRVRENVDKRQKEGLDPSNSTSHERPNLSGRVLGNFARNGIRKDAVSNKSINAHNASENVSAASSSHIVISDKKVVDKLSEKDASSKKRLSSLESSRAGGDGAKNNLISEEDFDDAPLQSGVVRIFKQPGIETPSDEDDFIEVRSKRQMLNDRREQREKEKEIKAKAKVTKVAVEPCISFPSSFLLLPFLTYNALNALTFDCSVNIRHPESIVVFFKVMLEHLIQKRM